MRCLWDELASQVGDYMAGRNCLEGLESLMVGQCANPDCRRELHYLRDGKIYAFAMSAGNARKSLEHFWL
jgi:hypothetical protein